MFTVEQVIDSRYPNLGKDHRWLHLPLLKFLRLLFHETQFRQFEQRYPHLRGLDFVDKVLEHFSFSYALRSNERERIPTSGALVIVANHPIGSLDGLALLSLVHAVRNDVKVVANDLLMAIRPLRPLLLPVDAMGETTSRDHIRHIDEHLQQGRALIIFPAGEVSRLSPQGVRDRRWRTGFLRLARRSGADILPVYVDGRNSLFFYSVSLLARPLATLLLVREMFRHASTNVTIRIGHAITPTQYTSVQRGDVWLAKRFKKQVYGLCKPYPKPLFPAAAKAVAHPENRQLLRQELREATVLGVTRDGKIISLFHYESDSVVMREIGRLRELAFRSVGEGTGERRDIDRFDPRYEHIVLWDDNDLEIVGAYRLTHAGEALKRYGPEALYSQTLFRYTAGMQALWPHAVELGRSFIQPRYWGRRGLDYLWQGIGAYLRTRPECRYLFGPVTMSNSYPQFAKDLMICFYRHYFPALADLASARLPYQGRLLTIKDAVLGFKGDDYVGDLMILRGALQASGLQIPTLFKQYTEAVAPGGASFLAFNIDPDFAHCVDGLILVDLQQLKDQQRRRYLAGDD